MTDVQLVVCVRLVAHGGRYVEIMLYCKPTRVPKETIVYPKRGADAAIHG